MQAVGLAMSIGVVSAVFLFTTLVVVIRLYLKGSHRFALYLVPMSLFPLLWVNLSTLSVVLAWPDLEIVAIIMLLPSGFSFVLLFDSLTRESVDPYKLSYLSAVSATFVLASVIELFGDDLAFFTPQGLEFVFFVRYLTWNLFSAPLGLLWIYYMGRIFKDTPEAQARYASVSLVGSIFVGVVNPLLVITQFGYSYGLHMLAFSFGVFLSAFAWAQEPKLAYVLPFKAFKIAVIETKSGLPLFTHEWNRDGLIEETALFTTVMQAVTIFVDETMQRGCINEITLEHATLIVKQDEEYDVASVLLTTKTSNILRSALEQFTTAFLNEYAQFLQATYDISKFRQASSLVKKHFAFVPEYGLD